MTVEGLDLATVRYISTGSTCDVIPTLRCEVSRLEPQASTPVERPTGSRVCAVLNGTARTTLGEERFDVAESDVYAIPSWATQHLQANVDTLDVFVTRDTPRA